MSIGQRLKEARKARGMSQHLLAEKIGASRGVVTNIEHDKVNEPQPMVVNAICSVLNISKEWLTTGNGSMDITNEAAHSAKVLSDIHIYAQELSEEEQRFILDIIKTYTKRLKN